MTRQSLKHVAEELDRRGREALRVYRPRPQQLPFHASPAYFRAIIGGNRSGKTTSAANEFGSAVTGIPIRTDDGPLPFNYPRRPLLAWIVGYDLKHIGQTIYRELFEEGKYQVIRRLDDDGLPAFDDDGIPAYETFQPWNPCHVERQHECKPVGPIIPERLIENGFKGIVWENKGACIFTEVPLVNGTIIRAYGSSGKAKQGDPVDVIWPDEDMEHGDHIQELEARLIDRGGRIFWSAMPQSANDALYSVVQRAEAQKGRPDPDVEAFYLNTLDNQFLAEKNKQRFVDGLSDAQAQARIYGGFMFDQAQIFDFKPTVHGVHSEIEEGKQYDKLSTLYAEMGELPAEWTRYLAYDPGWNTTALLVGTVPPRDEFGRMLIIEKELRLARQEYDQTAQEVADEIGHWKFEAFILDMHMGRQHHVGQARTVHENIVAAFKRVGLACRRSGSDFEPGNDNIEYRREATRERFRNGTLRVCLDKTPHFQQEIKKYRLAIRKHALTTTVVSREHDLMDCLEYLVAEDPQYVEPTAEAKGPTDPTLAFLAQLERRAKARHSDEGSVTLAAS